MPDNTSEIEIHIDRKTGDVYAHGPGLLKPLGRIAQQDGGWLSWDDRDSPVLRRPGRTDQDAARSLVLKGQLGRIENYVYD
ncbi:MULTISPECIES: hypothetical protein [Streptomyces]|uniref:Uncharacterized protein n=1 Tax=Streptomyces hokutonensis TaxID=1306990 RepID=A0ABW6MB74_9ACTN|nr:hypothetical protein OG504_39325 [Streptomyces sp. NBC_00986]